MLLLLWVPRLYWKTIKLYYNVLISTSLYSVHPLLTPISSWLYTYTKTMANAFDTSGWFCGWCHGSAWKWIGLDCIPLFSTLGSQWIINNEMNVGRIGKILNVYFPKSEPFALRIAYVRCVCVCEFARIKIDTKYSTVWVLSNKYILKNVNRCVLLCGAIVILCRAARYKPLSIMNVSQILVQTYLCTSAMYYYSYLVEL